MQTISTWCNIRVFMTCICLYGGCTLGIFAFPHTVEGFGRMNAHQMYATIGEIASCGLIDRALVDWYMLGATLEENIPPYNRYVYGTVMRLFPVYLLWCVVMSHSMHRLQHFRNTRERSGEHTSNMASKR